MSNRTATNHAAIPVLTVSFPMMVAVSLLAGALAVVYFPFNRSGLLKHNGDPSKKIWTVICACLLSLQCVNVGANVFLCLSQHNTPLMLSLPLADVPATSQFAFLNIMAIITISSSAPHILVMRAAYLGGYRGMSIVIATLAALAYVALFGSLIFAYRSNYTFAVSLAFITNVQLLVWPLPSIVVCISHACYAMGWKGHKFPFLLQSVLNTYAVGHVMGAMLWNIMTLFVLFNMGQRPLAWLITLEFVANAQIALTFKLLDVYHKSASALPTIWGDKEILSEKEVIPIA